MKMSDLDHPEKSKLCWSCQKPALYKCPRCEVRTCSAKCVKRHKETLKCNGIRCKTEYVPKERYTESNMLSDYRFLEEVDRHVSVCNRNRPYGFKGKGMKLKKCKADSMKITLRFLPIAFTKHKENTTYYSFHQKGFLWHVKWIFTACDVKVNEKRLSDIVPLKNAIAKHIDVTQKSDYFDLRLMEYFGKEVAFYMRKEDSPANKIAYCRLKGSLGLRENLCGKVVVEFPEVYVVLSEAVDEFETHHVVSE